MAKKKKTSTRKTTNPGIGYSGKVTVDLVRGGKVVKTIRTHNKGKLPLFNFIANCLAGKFYESLKPQYIQLFNAGSPNDAVSYIPTPYSSVGVETFENAETGDYCEVTFKFVVPFSILPTGATINQIRLYNQSNTAVNKEIAYFDLVDEQGQPLVITADGKSNVIITWVMKIANQQVTTA